MSNIALITAAGNGLRMGLDTPKQFLTIEGKELIFYAINCFESHDAIDSIYLICGDEQIEQMLKIVNKYGFKKVKGVLKGGSTRQESVFLGLNALRDIAKDDDIILIHDGARPLLDKDIITNNVNECLKYDAVETVIKATDTTIVGIEGKLINVLDRSSLYQVQTPQTFKYSLILKAHELAIGDKLATDDAQLIKKYLNRDVHLVEGNKKNFKVTTSEDLKILKGFIEE